MIHAQILPKVTKSISLYTHIYVYNVCVHAHVDSLTHIQTHFFDHQKQSKKMKSKEEMLGNTLATLR